MVKALTISSQKVYGRIALLLSTLLVTNFLFYIDEGYNDFRWMRDIGNWIVFVIYITVMLCVQLFVFEVVHRVYRWRGRVTVSVMMAWAATFLLLASFVFRSDAG